MSATRPSPFVYKLSKHKYYIYYVLWMGLYTIFWVKGGIFFEREGLSIKLGFWRLIYPQPRTFLYMLHLKRPTKKWLNGFNPHPRRRATESFQAHVYMHQTGIASTSRERGTISGTKQITAPCPGCLSKFPSIGKCLEAVLLGVAVFLISIG